jgi:hypothetical protein
MAQSTQLTWALLLAGTIALGASTLCTWATRSDPIVTLVSGALAGVTCVSVAMISASAGW